MSLADSISQLTSRFSDLLNLGDKSIFGLDIGLSAVKVAQLDTKDGGNSYVIQKYASVPLGEGAIIEDEIQKEEMVIDAISAALKKAKISSKSFCMGLGGPNTVVKRLQIAGGDKEEVEDQVLWEAEQYIPFDIDDAAVSFDVVGENQGGGMSAVVAAIREDVLNRFKHIAEKGTGAKAKIADLGAIAVTNVLEHTLEKELSVAQGSWLVLDIGAQKTFFLVYRKGLVFLKEMPIGGVMITEEIQRQVGVNYSEAEDLKISGDEQGNLPEEILEILDDVVEIFFTEIKKTLDFYITASSDDSFEKCVITGGSTLIPGFKEGLEALLGFSVSILNPFEKMTFNQKTIDESEANEIAYKGIAAIGLAMRQVKR